MTSNSSNSDKQRNRDEVVEHEPQSKHGSQGEAAHGGDQAGPNSEQAGRTVAPQMGDKQGTDVEVGAGG